MRVAKILTTSVTAAALAFSMLASAIPANAASGPGFHAAWVAQSAYATAAAGSTIQMSAVYQNVGDQPWIKGQAGRQANFGAGSTKDPAYPRDTTAYSAWNPGTWLAANRFAAQANDLYAPGQLGSWAWSAIVPLGTAAGVYLIHGTPVVDGATWLEDYGFFLQVTVSGTASISTSTSYSRAGTVMTGTGTATATADTVAAVTGTWENKTAGTTGSLACTPTDGAFNEIQEAFTCTGDHGGAGTDLVKITTKATSSGSPAATSSEIDWLGDTTAPTVTASMGTGADFNKMSATATDTQTQIIDIQYRVLNPDGSERIAFTTLPASDGTYNELTESASVKIDTTGFPNGTYIVEARAHDQAGNTSTTSVMNMTVTSGADTTAPACNATAVQSGLKVKTTGTGSDDSAVSNVEVKVQFQDSGIWTDKTSYTAATPDDGAFNETSETYTQTTGDLTIPNGSNVRSICRATDASGNQATGTSGTIVWVAAGTGGDVTVPTSVTVTTSTATPTTASSITVTGTATDNAGGSGIASVEYAVTRNGTGTTVTGWTGCASTDGGFNNENAEPFSCTITFPTETTAQAGNYFNILVRARDAAGNVSVTADSTSGNDSDAATGVENCTWVTQGQLATALDAAPAGTSSGSGNTYCVFRRDNVTPIISSAVKTTDGGTVGTVGGGDTITLIFNEELRSASTTTPQSLTLKDASNNTITLTNGVNATFTRTLNAGTSTWTVVPNGSVDSSVAYPATITAVNNFRDWAGSFAVLTSGDTVVD